MHTDPETLALLALGEEAATPAERAHIDACAECRRALGDLTAAAAAGRSTATAPTLVEPHGRVWEQIAATVRADAAAARPARTTPEAPLRSRPRHPQRSRDRAPGRSRRRGALPVRWLALAAAVVLVAVAGGVVTSFLLRVPGSGGGTSAPTVIARAALTALPDWPGATGQVLVESAGGERLMVVSVNAATERPDTYREVWLLSADLTQLVSVGLLAGDSGTFAIPADIDMSRYSIVDVSSEPLDGNPAHSSNSIVRGSLAT